MTSHTHPGHIGTCQVCGKRCFTSRKAARKAIRTIGDGDHMTAYRCGASYWHIGHLPKAVIKGKTSRDRIIDTRKATP
jgi:hypothetical protein